MPRLLYLALLPTLLMAGGKKTLDGGTAEPPPPPSHLDAGTSTTLSGSPPLDAGSGSDAGAEDAGCVIKPGKTVKSICWPKELKPLAVLDGSAIVAANAALQKILARYPKERANSCEISPRAFDVVVAQEGGWYFVRIVQRMDRCGWEVPPGFAFENDWFELYAVSPDGRVLERYPYSP